ncbi:uncharacterized protein LOC126163055 [Schistocerca cancellata]|uniref:uncharacterized protein LOC126163055 n=1 Tax=Schistocerca cancellata TaxID=274614 RepID=UPI0021183644|nr:uncharacterized protein LOC126163055 [Schistocerca cancellata]
MTTAWLLLLCALGVAVSLPQGRQGWWPGVLTLPPDLPDSATTSTTTTATPPQPPPTPPTPPPPTSTGAPASPVPCDCPTPPQYNPVCGSDNQTYTNPQKVECANTCGQRVTILYLGTCQLRRK